MRSNFLQKSVSLLLTLFFVNALCFQERAIASGTGESDNKPGKTATVTRWRSNAPEGSSLAPILIVGAVVVGGFILIKALKKGDKEGKKEEEKEKDGNKAGIDIYDHGFAESCAQSDFWQTADLKLQPYFAFGGFNNSGIQHLKTMNSSFKFGVHMNF